MGRFISDHSLEDSMLCVARETCAGHSPREGTASPHRRSGATERFTSVQSITTSTLYEVKGLRGGDFQLRILLSPRRRSGPMELFTLVLMTRSYMRWIGMGVKKGHSRPETTSFRLRL